MSAFTFTAQDHQHMQRALELAQRGLYTTDPNPRVGCVLVRDQQVVGEGWHRKAGEPHAEVYALQAAGKQANGATAYVTLEPCSHHGRTPPCAEALVAAGVTEVVIAGLDPNPQVNGQGVAKLKAAGIAVRSGLLTEAATQLNAGFIKRMQTGLPLVRVKLGMSLDGRTALANGVSQWITSEASRADVQLWRARSSVVMTGIGTVLADDPQLNVRDPSIDMLGRQPLRVVCDTSLRMPVHARMAQAPGCVIYTAATPQARGMAEVVRVGTNEGQLDLQAVLRNLAARGCNEVLVEAGPILSGRLLALRLVDELLLYAAPTLLGNDARALVQLPLIERMQDRIELELLNATPIGGDLRLHYRVRK
jgi:diaminohydroxyphosphoribosylaminopyrimidine deaminase / 5-amino-6-(5-phosphoribosylamino)uracil reductase